jgi:hypothetical protein
MLNNEVRERAAEVIGRILSESVFIFSDPLDESGRPVLDTWECRGVALDFTGYLNGSMALWSGEEFLKSSTANMLGVDEESEPAREKAMDALKEILNIIVGNLLTTLYGQEPVFDLGIPRVLERGQLVQDYHDGNALWLAVDGNPILFILSVGSGSSTK